MDKVKATALSFRISAHILIAVLAVTLSGVGPNRYWVAGLLVGVGSPLAILINLRLRDRSRNWAEALLDLVMIVAFIHLVPHLWMVLLCLGLMVALAPSVALHPASHWIYLGFGLLLIVGMTFGLVIHDVDGWVLPLLAVSVSYPSMLYYTYTQMHRHNDVRQRADMVRGMTRLAGSVAHDFNNLLTIVGGHVELAQLKLEENHPAKQDIKHVLEGTERASRLSRQLLSFSGRDFETTDRVDLAAEAQTVAELMAPVVPAGVRIRLEGPEHLWVSANVSQVNQILMNLILNAGEAMVGRTGEILVSLALKPGTRSDRVRLSVKDSGPGIPNSILRKIAEPFVSTKAEGHGLGLAATKRTVEGLGGTIDFTSDSKGTLVFVEWSQDVPQHSANGVETTTASDDIQRIGGKRALVVEDEAFVRKVANDMLEVLGYDAIEAADAFEALELFSAHHQTISFVLLDLKMPRKDGWELLAELREISPRVPVIVCSGYDPQENVKDRFENDPNLGFLQKPYRFDELREEVSALLG